MGFRHHPCFIAIGVICVGFFGGNAWSPNTGKAIPGRVSIRSTAQAMTSRPTSPKSENVPLITLQTSEPALQQGHVRALIASPDKSNKKLYAYQLETGSVTSFDQDAKTGTGNKDVIASRLPESAAIGPQGQIYLVDTPLSRVRVFSATGQPQGTLSLPRPESVAGLNDGSIAVASSVGENLLRVYDRRGQLLRSFGELKDFGVNDVQENRFLNNGKALAGPAETIYYVPRYSPAPTVRRFSKDGKLLSEFIVEGAAVGYQIDLAKSFLSEREANVLGGFHVITSADVDPRSGHLWLSVNGTTHSATVYEYDREGEKLREYALLLVSPSASEIITGIQDIVVRTPWIYVVTWENQVYKFNVNRRASAGPRLRNSQQARLTHSRGMAQLSRMFAAPSLAEASARGQLPCPTAQPFICTANCRSNSTPGAVDCAQEIKSRLKGTDVIYQTSCNNSPGPEPSCTATANWCSSETGVRGSTTVTLTCNPPTGGGSGGCAGEGSSCSEADCLSCQDIGGFLDPETCYCWTATPVLVDVVGNGFNLTSVWEGVRFDLNADGEAEFVAWTALGSDDALLVLDRNGNGVVDDGAELFGNSTPQPPSPHPNGFAALAEFDKPTNGGNGDGLIDNGDRVFSSLQLWQDSNHNGICEPNELHTLPSLGLASMDLDYRESRRRDAFGNLFRYRAKVYGAPGADLGRWAYDVFLVASR